MSLKQKSESDFPKIALAEFVKFIYQIPAFRRTIVKLTKLVTCVFWPDMRHAQRENRVSRVNPIKSLCFVHVQMIS